MTRNTTTGGNYETEICYLLENFSNHKFESQVVVGNKRNDGEHIVDILIGGESTKKPNRKRPVSNHSGGELISLKYQGVNGTAEEKIPFEFMKLQDAIDDYGYDSATIVLAGENGWSWKDYYLSDVFRARMKKIYPDVRIISHDQFIQEYLIQE